MDEAKIANWNAFLRPGGVALIGASNEAGSVGHAILHNLVEAPGAPPIYAVNPHEVNLEGAAWVADIADLPRSCDLAVIALPARLVPETVRSLGGHGIRFAVVISAGLSPVEREEMLSAARVHDMRLIGPNCLGVLLPHAGVNASFAPGGARAGGLAFLSQSGALTTAILDWAEARSIGFSAAASVGDMNDVGLGELVALFADDPQTRAILLYIEGLTDADRFLDAARAASTSKPVIAIKSGRSAAAGRAALSHTGALAGSYDVYRAAFRRAGIVMIESLDELFDAAAVIEQSPRASGERLAVVTNGGGAGILAVDALENLPGTLAELSDDTLSALDKVLPPTWSRANPLDIIGDARAERYRAAISAAFADPQVDAVLVVNCPTALASPGDVADAVIAACRERSAGAADKPVICCWLGDRNAAAVATRFAEAGLPLFKTPEDAVRGFSYLVQAERSRRRAAAPAADMVIDEVRRDEARRLIEAVRRDRRTLLSEIEAKRLLDLYAIPVARTVLAETPDDVAAACQDMTGPYVVKIVSPDITHKSDVGGVALGLSDAQAAQAAAAAMASQLAERFPQAHVTGFAVQPLIRRKDAHELFAGIATDPTFGPILMVGAGGKAIEVLRDRAIALPPVNIEDAEAKIAETRISRLLAGYRGVPPADTGAAARVLSRLSAMAVELPELAELDINPLLVNAEGAIALDARAVLVS